jgi:endonuclease/exonuclease/phosphatase family metal-dependent hydrolase
MFAFNAGASRWQREPAARAPIDLDEPLEVLTYNVLFSEVEAAARRAAVIDILAAANADIVALQEVTPEFLAGLLAAEHVRETYAVSTTSLTQAYDVVMLSALPATCHTLPLASSMGRKLHSLRLTTARGALAVAGTHLESSADQRAARLIQIDSALEQLREYPTAIVMGDLNFEPRTPEHERFAAHCYIDAWETLEPAADGHTRDKARNALAARIATTSGRIDHVYVRSVGWRPASVCLVGTTAIYDGGLTFPSDHFGLRCTLTPIR